MGKKTNPIDDGQLAAIGAKLREIIDRSAMRQQDVALAAGIGIRTLGWYLSGRDIPASTLIRIAGALDMNPGDLMRELSSVIDAESTTVTDLASRTVERPTRHLRAVAKKASRDRGGDDGRG